MTRILKAAAASAGLLGAAMLPLAAEAIQVGDAQQYTFATAIRDDQHAGEIDGQLVLRFAPGGIIQGQYRNYDRGGFKPVTGGFNGDQVWLTIGGPGPGSMRAVGTFRDGILRTTVQSPSIDVITLDSVGPAAH